MPSVPRLLAMLLIGALPLVIGAAVVLTAPRPPDRQIGPACAVVRDASGTPFPFAPGERVRVVLIVRDSPSSECQVIEVSSGIEAVQPDRTLARDCLTPSRP